MNTDFIPATPECKTSAGFQPLNWWQAAWLILGAVACFHAAYTPANPGPLALFIIGYVVCLVQLARLQTTRLAFYAGWLAGLACFGPQLAFFWGIFGPPAIALWAILAFWIALFVALTHVALARFGVKRAVWLVPFLWTGLEYFRSELYYLKFSWLNVGFAGGGFGCRWLGVYGLGFCVVIYASFFLVKSAKQVIFRTLLGFLCLVLLSPSSRKCLHEVSIRCLRQIFGLLASSWSFQIRVK